MTYRTILVHVDRSTNAAARYHLAAELARHENAHLVGTAMTGVPRYMLAGGPFDTSGMFIDEFLRRAAERADQGLAQFEEVARRVGVESLEPRRCVDDDYTGLCAQARYADLVVIGQADPDARDEGRLLQDLPEFAVLNCGRPVLLVPHAGNFAAPCKRPLIAWNASVQAARAITASLPLLRSADKVIVAILNPQQPTGAHGDEAGADIGTYLARHGVNVEVQSRPHASDVGTAMLSLASDNGADLLVMGGYGHSRLREVILGGATRTVLAKMTLPVLMVH